MKKNLRPGLLLLILLAAYFLGRCYFLDVVPSNDAYAYFSSLNRAVQTLATADDLSLLPSRILGNFNFYGHPSMGYGLVLAIPQLLDNPNHYLLNLTNLLLAVLAVFSFYRILRYFAGSDRHIPEILIATAVFAYDPLFVATSIAVNTDFPMLVFMLAAFNALLRRKPGWFFLFSLLLIFSKEPGVLYYSAMILGVSITLLSDILKRKKLNAESLANTLADREWPVWKILPVRLRQFGRLAAIAAVLVLPGILFGLYLLLRENSLWVVGAQSLSFNSSGANCFGFNRGVMIQRLAEMFILNFHWVPVLLMALVSAAALAVKVFRRPVEEKTVSESPEGKKGLLPISIAGGVFVLFNLTFITFIIPRYTVQAGFFLLFFLFLLLIRLVPKNWVRWSVWSLLFLLFFVQTYRTVDPLSQLVFRTRSFGEHKLLMIDNPYESIGNGMVYNTEFSLVDKLLNRVNREIGIRPDTTLITYYERNWYTYIDSTGALIDRKTLNRNFNVRNSFRYRILPVHLLNSTNAPPEAYYLYMPWLDVVSDEMKELEAVRRIYRIEWVRDIGYRGYFIRTYRLKKNGI